jgi:hypothetical protein
MPRTNLSGMILGLLVFCCGGVILASEADELRERAKVLQKKASISAKQGNPDQAKQLERESVELMEAAERLDLKAKENAKPGIDMEVRRLKDRLQDLLAQEKKMRDAKAPEKDLATMREQIAGTERELQKTHAHQAGLGKLPPEFQAQAEKLETASRRIQHLRVAAENLKMAEAHELALKIMENAEAMDRDVQEGKKRLAAEMQKIHGGDQGQNILRALKEEIERLRSEVKELRQKVEKR